jgi:uncharacterized Ntn-hydrolase superfamily protein
MASAAFQSALYVKYNEMFQELQVKYRIDEYEKDIVDLTKVYQKLLSTVLEDSDDTDSEDDTDPDDRSEQEKEAVHRHRFFEHYDRGGTYEDLEQKI